MADDKVRLMLEVLLKDKNFKKKLKESENAMKKSSKKQEGFINRIKKSWIGITIVLGAVTLAMKKVVDAAMVQEKAEKTLAAAMKVAGTYTKEAYEHNLEYAKSLQEITTYGDEVILGAQKMLTNFGIEGKALDNLTKATLDLASAKGMDLKAASDLVAKSVGSSTNALTRYGIEVSGLPGSTERAESAIRNITNLFGGAAQAEAQTYAGQVKQLSNTFGDAQEIIGDAFLPMIGDLVKISKKALEVYIDLPRPLQRTAIAIAGIGVAAVIMVKALKMSIAKAGLLSAALTTVYIAYEAIKWTVDKTNTSMLGWQKILKKTDLEKATKDLKGYNTELEEYEKRIGAAGKTRDKWKAEKITKAQNEYNRLLQEEGYSVKKANKWWTKRIEKIDEMNIAWTGYEIKVKNTTAAIEEYNKKSGETKPPGEGGKEPPPDTTDMKKAWEDYYTFIGDLRQVDIDKETERHENETAAIEELREAGKITEEEYLLALEAIQLAHLERMGEIGTEHDILEEEKASKTEKLAQKRRDTSLKLYGKYYKDLTKAQKKEVNKMLKDWKEMEISKKELSDTFTAGFLGGIDSMKSSSKDVAVSMIKQFVSMIAGKLAALSALHFASLNIPAGVAALAAAGTIKALGGTIAATIAGYAKGGEVAYAAAGLTPRGTDTVPAMLTPGEEVLPVPVANAYRSLMNAVAMPSAGGTSNVNNNTTNEGDSIINNEFNNNFEGNTIDEMLELSQNTGTDLLRR